MSERADYISIGQHIAHAIGEDTWSNAILECEGEDFHRTIAPDVSPRMLLKQLHFNMLGYELLERALVMIRGTVSKPILISENGAHCTVTVVNTDKPELLKGVSHNLCQVSSSTGLEKSRFCKISFCNINSEIFSSIS